MINMVLIKFNNMQFCQFYLIHLSDF